MKQKLTLALAGAAVLLVSSTTSIAQVQLNVCGVPPLPPCERPPLMHELAKTDADREVLEFVSLSPALGRPFVARPGLPPERVTLLRRAFDATMRDPEFLADAAHAKLEIEPNARREARRHRRRTLRVSPDTIKGARWP